MPLSFGAPAMCLNDLVGARCVLFKPLLMRPYLYETQHAVSSTSTRAQPGNDFSADVAMWIL
jgi:hypothetical protein